MADPETKKDVGGGSKLPGILHAVNTLLLAGVLGLLLLRPGAAAQPGGPAAPKAEKAAEKAALPGPIVKFPDFVVHLRDPDVDRFLRLTLEAEVEDEKAKELVTARLPAIRDSFISFLSDRSTADLRGSEAIEKVKVELRRRLVAAAPDLALRGLYVTELVVQ